jgi:hypothetical protein
MKTLTAEEILEDFDIPITYGSKTRVDIIKAMEQYASQFQISREKIVDLIEWLNSECPNVAPPLEPYTTADLSHDFAEKLRDKLNELSELKSKL